MLLNLGIRTVLKSSAGVLCENAALRSAVSVNTSSLLSGPTVSRGRFTVSTPIRHYARGAKNRPTGPQSHLSDLHPSMLKFEYASIPLAQTTDDLVKRLLSLELANHGEKLRLKTEQLIAKVQQDENDRSSVEVRVAIQTARIRNYQEHLQKHHKNKRNKPNDQTEILTTKEEKDLLACYERTVKKKPASLKDKANKRLMLMTIDKRKKLLKKLRLVNYEAFERVCEQLGITYTFPPEYYRRATKRWLAKKEFCIKVFKAVQAQKAEQRLKERLDSTKSEANTSKA